jgi:hypothetical protein
VAGLSSAAQAAPITGEFSKAGSFVPVDGETGAIVPIGDATGIDFTAFNNTPSPGVAGSTIVVASSGDFLALAPVGTIGSIKDFTFIGNDSAAYPSAPILTFEIFPGLTIDLLTVSLENQDATSFKLTGTILFHHALYDDTPGVFVLNGNTTVGATFGFAATQSAVPEPASMALFGLGALGVGVLRRRNALVA